MKILRTLLALSSLSLLAGCASDSGIKIDNSWINGDYTGDRLSNLLVVGLAPNEANVKIWEDAFVAQLQKSGRRGTPAYTIFTKAFLAENGVDNEEAAKAKIRELGFDGVILGKIRDVESGPVVEGGETHVMATPAYYSFYSYYAPQVYQVQDKTRVVQVNRVRVETNIYAVKGETLVYTAMIDSINMGNDSATVTGLVESVIKDLKSRKVL